MYSALLSCFYIATYVILFLSFLFIKKSNKKINIVVALPIYIMLEMLYSNFYAGIINIFSIPVNLVSLGIGNLLMSVIVLAVCIKTKTTQRYRFELFDAASVLVISLVVFFIAKEQFGINLIVNYETTDPTRHLRIAQNIIETGQLGYMYFTSLSNSTLISVGLGFFKSFWSYKFFILSDVIMFWLSAMLFYSITRLFSKKTIQKVIAIIVSIVYIIGYPLNNMVFGFVYLGVGVSICAYLIFIAYLYQHNKIYEWCAIAAMMLGCYGIISCYSLFAPFIYVAVAIFITIKYISEKKFLSKKYFISEFSVFLIPTVMGMYYSFFKAFAGGMDEVGSSIATEGYIYRDLYSCFVFILPAVIYGIITAISKRKICCHHITMLIFFVSTLVMFVMGMQGKVSSYYYYKMYYVLWLLCFVVAIEGICDLCEKSFASIVSYSLVWIFLAFMNFTTLDDKISEKNILMSPSSSASGAFFSIFEFNIFAVKNKNFPVEQLTLYEEAYNLGKDDKKITLLSTTEPIYWCEPFIQRDLSEFYCYNFDDCNIEQYMEKVEACDYVIVPTDYDSRFEEYVCKWDPVFTNESGTIYSLK